MTVEHACVHAVQKPWGSVNLRPWSEIDSENAAIGELWFERANSDQHEPDLLLKLLFTKEPLSIQVHPNDAFAKSIGLKHGKSEAWYILSATPDAQVAIGLKRQLTSLELQSSIEDGSISDLVQWYPVSEGDVIFVPGGTIHALGGGLVLAEVQQRSDATFRLFDFGRDRDLHVIRGVAAARAEPAECQSVTRRLTDARTLLIADEHFVLERIDLVGKSNWDLRAEGETWLLVLEGHARVDLMNVLRGEAIFLTSDSASIRVGVLGLKALLAYVGNQPSPNLLHNLDGLSADFPDRHLPGQLLSCPQIPTALTATELGQ